MEWAARIALMAKDRHIAVCLRRGEDGKFIAEYPLFEGCIVQGPTREQALENLREAMKFCIECAHLMPGNGPTSQKEHVNMRMGTRSDIERAEEDARLAEEAGFALPATVVPFGTEVIDDGQRRYRCSHLQWEEMAPARGMLTSLRDAVLAQQRRDWAVKLSELEMLPTGELQQRVGVPDPAVLTKDTWRQFTSYGYVPAKGEPSRRLMPAGAGTFLAAPDLPKSWRARQVNYFLQQAHPEGRCLARTWQRKDGGREVYAFLGSGYTAECDADKAAQVLLDASAPRGRIQMPGGRGQALVEGAKWSLDVLWHSNLGKGELVVAGEVFQAGIRITSADDGSAGVRVKALLWRNLCLNFLIIGTAAQEAFTTHQRRQLGPWLISQVEKALRQVSGFTRKWGEAERTALLGASRTDPGEAFGKLVELEFLTPPEGSGLSHKEYVDRLVAAHRAEGGITADPRHVITVADACNATSRAAHSYSWASPWMQQEQEEQAGALYQEVRVWRAAA